MLKPTRIVLSIPVQVALPLLFTTNGLFLGMWIASIPDITGNLELTRGETGTVLTAFPLGALVAFPLAAFLMNQFGSRASILRFGLLRALTFPLLAIAPNELGLASALAVVGFAHGGLDVTLNRQGVEIERQTGGSILSRAHAAYSVGTLTGSLGAGLLEQAGVVHVMLFLVPTGLGMVLFWLSRSSLVTDAAATPSPPALNTGASIRRTISMLPSALVIILAIAFIAEIGEEAISDWYALYLREDLHSLPAAASFEYPAFAVAVLVGRIFGDSISNRMSPLRVLQLCGVVAAIGMTIGVAIDTTAAMLTGTVITGLGYSLILPTVYRFAGSLKNVTPSTALAMLATVLYLGYLVGPLLIGPVSDITSLRLALAGVVILFLAVPVLTRLGEAMSDKHRATPVYAPVTSSETASKNQ